MKHYLRVYKEFIRTSAAKQMSFRIHFALVVLMEFFYYLTGILTVTYIYNHTQFIGPWDKDTFLFFVSFIFLQDNFQMIMLSHNYWQFSEDLKTGYFDFIILKPLSSIFTVFFRYFRFSTIFTLPVSIGLVIYYGIKIDLSILSWILLLPIAILGFALKAQIEFLLCSFMFWTTQGNGINFLRMQMHEVSSKPEFIYHSFFKKFIIYLLPIAFISSLPVQYLININQVEILLGLLGALITTNIALRFVWKKGLARYESASS